METRLVRQTLPDGEELVIRVIEPPLGGYADKVGIWKGIRERLSRGDFVESSIDRFFIGEVHGEVAGSMSIVGVSRDTEDVGCVEFVQTHPRHRRKGIASCISQVMLEMFKEDGGIALYLCTVNPVAYKLYRKQGFNPYVGDGLRYLIPGNEDFDETFLSYGGEATVRDAKWCDIGRLCVLYNHPKPDWLIKDYLQRVFRKIRFESHFVRMFNEAQGNYGALLVLENPKKRVVGSASLIEMKSFYEQHVKILDFRVHPTYFHQTNYLLESIIKKAQETKTETIQAYVADCDKEKKRLLMDAGFMEEARLKERLKTAEGRIDLLIYALKLEEMDSFPKDISYYYGGRPSFFLEDETALEEAVREYTTKGTVRRVVSGRIH